MKFTKTQWKAMPVVAPADERQAQIRADGEGNMWIWVRANGHHVWADAFKKFPWRNDLHRLMCQPASWFKS